MNLFDLIKPFKELKDLIQKYTIRSIVCEASCHHVILSSCHHFIMSSCHCVIISPNHHSIDFNITTN